jgi:lycopene cyclase domain-containing protein
MPVYLYVLLLSLAYPLSQSFEHRLKYATKWKALFPGLLITAAFFLIWDEIFTQRGVWGFNPDYLVGWYIGHMPIEEWMFFIMVPFASVFIYECVLYFLKRGLLGKAPRFISALLAIAFLLLSVVFYAKDYTFWSFLFTGILLAIHTYWNRVYMADFYIAYLIHLIPFFIVNGVLTGSWLDAPIVWYNDEENLSLRFFTIPIEDAVYGMLLLLMNISFYEYFKIKQAVKHN